MKKSLDDVLQHYGILGMHWGQRRGITRSRQLAFDKDSLKRLNNGGHVSVGFTKKRQEAYDKRDKAILEKRIKTNEEVLAKRASKNSEDHNKKVALKQKKVNEMSNSELKILNERLQLEKTYKDLTKSDVAPGRKVVTDILTNASKETAKNYASKTMSKGLDIAVKAAMMKAGRK